MDTDSPLSRPFPKPGARFLFSEAGIAVNSQVHVKQHFLHLARLKTVSPHVCLNIALLPFVTHEVSLQFSTFVL